MDGIVKRVAVIVLVLVPLAVVAVATCGDESDSADTTHLEAEDKAAVVQVGPMRAVVHHREQRWRIAVDPRLSREDLTEDDDENDLVLKIEEVDSHGSVQVHLYSIQTIQYIDGIKVAPPSVAGWITHLWWHYFGINHPVGDLHTYSWPTGPEGENPTFLVLPDLAAPAGRLGVVTGDEQRPVEISQTDATDRLRFVQFHGDSKIGTDGTVTEASRGVLEGTRPRVGKETVLRYAWRSATHSYRLFVGFTRDGYKRWGAAVRKTLESMEFGIR